jgi:hypothetical protein
MCRLVIVSGSSPYDRPTSALCPRPILMCDGYNTMGGHPFYLVKDLLRVLAEV